MKLAKFVLAEAVYAIEFNPDGKSTELAQLEKWSKLAHKFFDLHGSDLRKYFVRKWIGSENKKFDKQITKLTRAFNRCGTHLDPVMLDKPQNYTNIEADIDGQNREKRSNEDPQIMEKPGHRMIHIVHNMKKWTKTYLSECKNQNKIVTRYEKFEDKFENELMKSMMKIMAFMILEGQLLEDINSNQCKYLRMVKRIYDRNRLCKVFVLVQY